MRYRKLRIAWSAVWAIAAVLLVAIWVRSYSRKHSLSIHSDTFFSSSAFELYPYKGTLYGFRLDGPFRRDSHFGTANEPIESATPPVLAVLAARQPVRRTAGIQWLRGGNFSACGIPLAYAVALCAALAGAAGLPLSMRYSLRTLLIATAIVAVGLGLLVWLR